MTIWSCDRGHVFRARSRNFAMPCPTAIGHDLTTGQARYCPETAYLQGPRVDVLATPWEEFNEKHTVRANCA